jgi:hypothetical protein
MMSAGPPTTRQCAVYGVTLVVSLRVSYLACFDPVAYFLPDLFDSVLGAEFGRVAIRSDVGLAQSSAGLAIAFTAQTVGR